MKSILLHEVPIVVLALGAIFGLDANEQSVLSQSLTAIIGAVFAIIPIVANYFVKKKSKAQK